MFGNCCGTSPVVEEINAAPSIKTSSVKGKVGLTVDTSGTVQDMEDQDDEDEIELGGMSEPPVTPVGRDELALRRHRFFNDLMAASQGIHKVRFDPRGPSFSGIDSFSF
ncbi:hypothetical protein GE061_011203 [Apolygus lucorum]|uniref:Uncharacterized protein n=1 Tax=Apolygus lucorum TaxID=248454 RepID=A0A8S9XX28_APOLU|nr:hypothetical protein GE061_011203 [Apolygus lucorum]